VVVVLLVVDEDVVVVGVVVEDVDVVVVGVLVDVVPVVVVVVGVVVVVEDVFVDVEVVGVVVDVLLLVVDVDEEVLVVVVGVVVVDDVVREVVEDVLELVVVGVVVEVVEDDVVLVVVGVVVVLVEDEVVELLVVDDVVVVGAAPVVVLVSAPPQRCRMLSEDTEPEKATPAVACTLMSLPLLVTVSKSVRARPASMTAMPAHAYPPGARRMPLRSLFPTSNTSLPPAVPATFWRKCALYSVTLPVLATSVVSDATKLSLTEKTDEPTVPSKRANATDTATPVPATEEKLPLSMRLLSTSSCVALKLLAVSRK
jgi:hypothetical protein